MWLVTFELAFEEPDLLRATVKRVNLHRLFTDRKWLGERMELELSTVVESDRVWRELISVHCLFAWIANYSYMYKILQKKRLKVRNHFSNALSNRYLCAVTSRGRER